MRDRRLLLAAVVRLLAGIGILGVLLFAAAGSVAYWNGWLFLGVLTAVIAAMGAYLYRNDKELLRKRLNSREKEKAQGVYAFAGGISLFAAFLLCGLDYRFGWSSVPMPVAAAALAVFLAGFGLFTLTLRQNSFASRTVEIQERQKVIDTGVYAVIRHPMYTASLMIFLASPLVLGSYFAMLPLAVYLFGIIFRIGNEEKVLREGLEGYDDYTRKVRYRLLPFVW